MCGDIYRAAVAAAASWDFSALWIPSFDQMVGGPMLLWHGSVLGSCKMIQEGDEWFLDYFFGSQNPVPEKMGNVGESSL